MDGGAWWAAVHGVTKSRTQLMRLNSSSSSGAPYLIVHEMKSFQYFTFNIKFAEAVFLTIFCQNFCFIINELSITSNNLPSHGK